MSQGQERVVDQDPDYESVPLHAQQKRIKLHEQDAKEAAVKKIEQIVRSQFSNEISARESELDLINQRIYQLQMMLDRLRVGIITKYYASGVQAAAVAADSCGASVPSGGGWEDSQQALASVHPTVRQFLGKAPVAAQLLPRSSHECHSGSQAEQRAPVTLVAGDSSGVETTVASGLGTEPEEHNKKGAAKESGPSTVRIGRGLRCKNKVRVIVGNVSKYIPLDRRDGGSGEQATHKWLAYVRMAPEEPQSIAELVRRVRFFLHPSYRPHDLVEVTEAPFQVQRKGWGEFPLRVQLHFHDRWTKHVDIIHHLKLDKTYTGLQTLGAETVVDLWIPSSAARTSENSSIAADDTIELHENITACAETARIAASSSLAASNEAKTANGLEATGSPVGTNKITHVSPDDRTSQPCSQTSGTTVRLLPVVTSALLVRQPCEMVAQMEMNPVKVGSSVPDTEHKGEPCPVELLGVGAASSPKPERKNCSTARNKVPPAKTVVLAPAPSPAPGAPSLVSIAPKDVTPKKAPAVVSSNGVVSSTFVKCTDTLGRVLLIPATSLLSPPCTPAIKPVHTLQQSSLLRPTAVAAATQGEDGSASVSTVPAVASPSLATSSTSCPMAAASSTCTPSTSIVDLAAGGAPSAAGLASTSTAIGITHQQVAPLSRISGKASTCTTVPASAPDVTSVVSASVLPSITTFTLSAGSPGLTCPIATPSGTAAGISVKTAPAALRPVKSTVSSAAVINKTGFMSMPLASSVTAAGQSWLRTPNTSSVVCVTPFKTGMALATANRSTNLISVMCNKPSAASVNVPTSIVPANAVTSSALTSAAPASANITDILCVSSNNTAPEAGTEVAPRMVPSMVSLKPSPSAVKPTAPSALTYNLVMLPGTRSGHSQIVVLPTNVLRPKNMVPATLAVQRHQSLLPPASPESQTNQITVAVPPATTLPEQPEKVDPAKELRNTLDAIRLSEFKDMRAALFAVAAHFPLVGVTEAEKLSCFPYAATDGATYFSWPLPKQRASEWMRACDVRQTLQRLVDCQQPTWLSSFSAANDCQRLLSSRRSIVLLCRHFGLTPLHPDTGGQLEDTEMASAHTGMHNSYSEPCDLVSRLAEAMCAAEGAQKCAHVTEEEVDVEGVGETDNGLQKRAEVLNSKTKPSAYTSDGTFLESPSSEKCPLRKAKVHLPLSPMAAFVREAASEIGVHLTSCELEPRVDVPVVEEMIASACKNFATTLLRSAVNMAFKRVHYESTPSTVTLEDTYRGILDLRECSFLTNENLGIEVTREGSCDDAHV